MTKILQVNESVNHCSTGKIAEQIGTLIIQEGWHSTIAFGRTNSGSLSEIIKIGNLWDVRFHALESRLLDDHGLGSRMATRRFVEKIKELQPDIIHLHNIHGYYLNYKILFDFLREYNHPVVWTLHDCWTFTGHCAYFDYCKCEKWKTHCHDCLVKREYPKRWLLDRSCQNYDDKRAAFASLGNVTLVPVSDWLAGLLKQSFLKIYPIKVIHNGIDLKVFKPIDRKKRNSFKILGVTNIWDKRKGIEDIVELRKILPDDYEITLVGYKEKRFLPLPQNIIDIPRTNNQQELAELYADADVVINPTHEDNFPTVNLEALASGTPVITYNTGGSPESLDEKTGVVVPVGDVNAMATAITRMREHPLSSETCRQRAEEYFDKDKCFQEYIELYNKLLN